MGATNSVGQFWRIVCRMLEGNRDDGEAYFDDVRIDGPKTKYNDEEILPGIRRYMFEHFQHIDRILVSIELAGAKIAGEKSYWCQDGIIVVGFVCDYDGRHPETAKVRVLRPRHPGRWIFLCARRLHLGRSSGKTSANPPPQRRRVDRRAVAARFGGAGGCRNQERRCATLHFVRRNS